MATARNGTISAERAALHGVLAAGAAVVLWGALPVMRAQASQLPALQMTALALMCACVVASLSRVGAGGAATTRLPAWLWLTLGTLLVGAIALYFAALTRAPAAPVTLITYVWPLMFVMASEVITLRRVRLVVLAGAVLAFGGAAVLVTRDWTGGLALTDFGGYALGLGSGACWTVYSLLLQGRARMAADGFPVVFAVGAAVAGVLHLALETPVWPLSAPVAATTAAIGAGPYGLAFIAWGHGLRHAPARAVGPLSYAVPLIAAGWLTAMGLAEPSWRLALAAAGVVAGVAVSQLGSRRATP